MTQKIALEKKSELDYYFEELRDKSINSNILNWWKVNSAKYPVISIMARDILAILVSTVAFESIFNIGGKVLDQYKSSLKSETTEVLTAFALSILNSNRAGGLALSWKSVVKYEKIIFFKEKKNFFSFGLGPTLAWPWPLRVR